MDISAFVALFGTPAPGSAVTPGVLGLPATQALRSLDDERLRGVFAGGLLSIASRRENGGDLGPWSRHLPGGARLLASSAFGFLFATTGSDLWVVDPHAGQVVESDIPLPELPEVVCEPELREDFLRESLFRRWHALDGGPLVEQWLCPTPVPALGGSWSVESLRRTDPAFFLSFTAQLFADSGPHAVQVRRLAGP
jgi:hypothetical protein